MLPAICFFDPQGFFATEGEAAPAEPPDVGFHLNAA